MQRYFAELKSRQGRAIGGATVRVYNAGTTTLASLYSDRAGTIPLGNPLTTNADGEYAFYATNGRYDLSFTATGYQLETERDITLYDRDDETGGVGTPINTDVVAEGAANLYFRQDRVRGSPLTGFSTGSTADVTAADTVMSAIQKLQGKWGAIDGVVRGVVISGLSTATTTAIVDTDTVLEALGKLQGQITLRPTINAPVSLTSGVTLTAATHANRQILYNGGNGNLTVQSDASGGTAADDEFMVVTADASSGVPFLVLPDASTLAGGSDVILGAVRKGTNLWQRYMLPRDVFSSGKRGLVPAAGGTPSATKFLTETGAWATPAGGGSSTARYDGSLLYMPQQNNTSDVTIGITVSNLDSSTNTAVQSASTSVYTGIARNRRTGAAAAVSRLAGMRVGFSSPLISPSSTVSGAAGYTCRTTGAVADAIAAGQFGTGVSQNAPAWTNASEPSAMVNCIFLGADSTDTQMFVMHNDGAGACTKVALNGGTGFPANTNAADMYEFRHTFNAGGGSRSVDYTAKNLVTGVSVSGTLTTNLPVENVGMNPFTCRGSANVATTPVVDCAGWAAGNFV